MQIEHPFPWHRIPQTLEATPVIIQHLVTGISDAEADYRPDPERLTIREIIPHIAEWEQTILVHLVRICREDVPNLDDDNTAEPMTGPPDVAAQCALFARCRAATVAFLKDRTTADWSREAIRSRYGPTTLDAQAVMLAMHDTYHIRQIVEWKERYADLRGLSGLMKPDRP